MAALVEKPPILPGLDTALEIQDFRTSGALYNTLLDDSDQPPVADECITDLAEIFVRHNAEKVLGIHLIHGHFKIPKSTVMLGTNFESPPLRWTKVTDIDNIDPSCVHGHIFALTKDGLCAYELQDGPLPDLSGVGPRFLDEFIIYIVKNDLTSLIGLQVLGCGNYSMSELILDKGTVMLESTYVKNTVPTRITGWKFEATDGRPRVCSASETHAVMTSGNHKVFNAGKPLPKLENVDDLKAALATAGIL
ncbi:hypothetical protein N7478_000769 [Penicillium angulare]|uniref:uncharacterized protein n=1 Tax=Penicillium angulare TaxID=116970 RepID=UPI0025401DC8|nr:uncharacterized protein N7478_000769 [Penicillium angulare]KAJ5291518.1 hypothetical protein N7478_000769 [Penicillium angulare]